MNTVHQNEPFELILDTRECQQYLTRDDIFVQFTDVKTGQVGKMKIVQVLAFFQISNRQFKFEV